MDAFSSRILFITIRSQYVLNYYCLLKLLKEHLRAQPSWKGRGRSAPVKTGRVFSCCSMEIAQGGAFS